MVISRVILRVTPFRALNTYNLLTKSPAPSSMRRVGISSKLGLSVSEKTPPTFSYGPLGGGTLPLFED